VVVQLVSEKKITFMEGPESRFVRGDASIEERKSGKREIRMERLYILTNVGMDLPSYAMSRMKVMGVSSK